MMKVLARVKKIKVKFIEIKSADFNKLVDLIQLIDQPQLIIWRFV